MICQDCNSESFEVILKENLDFETEAIEFNLEVTHCPFCGSNLEWSQRGGYDATEDHEDRLDI
jgi:transposase-like protein